MSADRTDRGLAALRERAAAAVRFHRREAVALALLGLLVIAGAVVAYARARPSGAPPPTGPAVTSPDVSASPEGELVVHVVGAVHRPGVYTFAPGARVVDAVRAAGGFAPGADSQAINLARPLVDGEQIVVPRRGETTQGGATQGAHAAQQNGKLNINTANAGDFDRLPGIGPVLAQRIVDYRTQHGPFRDIKDLMKVPGIGPKKFDSLASLVTV